MPKRLATAGYQVKPWPSDTPTGHFPFPQAAQTIFLRSKNRKTLDFPKVCKKTRPKAAAFGGLRRKPLVFFTERKQLAEAMARDPVSERLSKP